MIVMDWRRLMARDEGKPPAQTTDKEMNSYDVVVKEELKDDAGRGIARLSLEVMRHLSLVSGDPVEIQGKTKAVAIVWPGTTQDTGKGIIRIDSITRSNAGTSLDERVQVQKTKLGHAKTLVINPTEDVRLIGGEQYFGRVLLGRAVMEGQTIRVDVIGNSLTFVISEVTPNGAGVVSEDTRIVFKETPHTPGQEEEKETVSEPEKSQSYVPHLVGIYHSPDVAKVVAGRLIDSGLPVFVERLDSPPPYSVVFKDPDNTQVHGHTGPVWAIRTDYTGKGEEDTG